MKKIALAFVAVLMMTGVTLAQYKTKKMVIPIQNRASTIGIPVKVGDFIYIVADSAMYMSRVAFGPNGTGTYLLADTSRYSVAKMATGRNALTATTLDVSGNVAINTNKFNITASSGNTTVAGTLGVTGDVAVNTNKFNVTAASGNTAVAGTLGVTGNVAVNTNKFNVTAASGNTAIAGTLGVTGNMAVNTDKFTVTAASGNTLVAGTLGVTGVTTIQGQTLSADHVNNLKAGNSITATDTLFGAVVTGTGNVYGATIGVSGTDTVTAAPVGSLCYRAADSTLYLKIKLTGPKSARWQKVTVGKP